MTLQESPGAPMHPVMDSLDKPWLLRSPTGRISAPLAAGGVRDSIQRQGLDPERCAIAPTSDWRAWTPLLEHPQASQFLPPGCAPRAPSPPSEPAAADPPSPVDLADLMKANVAAAEEAAKKRPRRPAARAAPAPQALTDVERLLRDLHKKPEYDIATQASVATHGLASFLGVVARNLLIGVCLARLNWLYPTFEETLACACWTAAALVGGAELYFRIKPKPTELKHQLPLGRFRF